MSGNSGLFGRFRPGVPPGVPNPLNTPNTSVNTRDFTSVVPKDAATPAQNTSGPSLPRRQVGNLVGDRGDEFSNPISHEPPKLGGTAQSMALAPTTMNTKRSVLQTVARKLRGNNAQTSLSLNSQNSGLEFFTGVTHNIFNLQKTLKDPATVDPGVRSFTNENIDPRQLSQVKKDLEQQQASLGKFLQNMPEAKLEELIESITSVEDIKHIYQPIVAELSDKYTHKKLMEIKLNQRRLTLEIVQTTREVKTLEEQLSQAGKDKKACEDEWRPYLRFYQQQLQSEQILKDINQFKRLPGEVLLPPFSNFKEEIYRKLLSENKVLEKQSGQSENSSLINRVFAEKLSVDRGINGVSVNELKGYAERLALLEYLLRKNSFRIVEDRLNFHEVAKEDLKHIRESLLEDIHLLVMEKMTVYKSSFNDGKSFFNKACQQTLTNCLPDLVGYLCFWLEDDGALASARQLIQVKEKLANSAQALKAAQDKLLELQTELAAEKQKLTQLR